MPTKQQSLRTCFSCGWREEREKERDLETAYKDWYKVAEKNTKARKK